MSEPIRHLYFHIPFCPKLCPYCCFYVEVGSRNKTTAFLDALLREVENHAADLQPRTIYFGGGTPSALTCEQLDYLFSGLRERLDLSALEEWDLEANPATIRADKAEADRVRQERDRLLATNKRLESALAEGTSVHRRRMSSNN